MIRPRLVTCWTRVGAGVGAGVGQELVLELDICWTRVGAGVGHLLDIGFFNILIFVIITNSYKCSVCITLCLNCSEFFEYLEPAHKGHLIYLEVFRHFSEADQ